MKTFPADKKSRDPIDTKRCLKISEQGDRSPIIQNYVQFLDKLEGSNSY